MRGRWWFTALLLAALATPAGAAERDLYISISSTRMQQLFAAEGFPDAQIDGDDDLVVRMHDYQVLVMVRSNNYATITYRFAVRAAVSPRMINDWNREMHFSKVYLDREGDPVLEMDVDLTGGVTEARIRDSIETFADSLAAFIDVLP